MMEYEDEDCATKCIRNMFNLLFQIEDRRGMHTICYQVIDGATIHE